VEGAARVDFSLPATAANVPLVRHALAGLAEVLGMGPQEIADLKTVVTEACTNVVAHAYEGDLAGPLEVSAGPENRRLVVSVRDYGQGIKPLADTGRRSLRLGLPLMAALSDAFELSQSPGGGTTVTMRIRFSSNGDKATPPPPPVGEQARIDIRAGAALGPVLSRIFSMFASRADLTVDRLADAVLLSDAISAGGAQAFPDETARIAVVEDAGRFEVRIGPLSAGGAAGLLEAFRIPRMNASLEGLADEVRVEESDEGETLVIAIGSADTGASAGAD
jgi:anti-sigma regulatory factor (Ser/Thr protein kinase)